MQVMYCWRCRGVRPMLDEAEFDIVSPKLSEGLRSVKAYRERHGVPLDEVPVGELYEEARLKYRARVRRGRVRQPLPTCARH
jgi:hypothetical protein